MKQCFFVALAGCAALPLAARAQKPVPFWGLDLRCSTVSDVRAMAERKSAVELFSPIAYRVEYIDTFGDYENVRIAFDYVETKRDSFLYAGYAFFDQLTDSAADHIKKDWWNKLSARYPSALYRVDSSWFAGESRLRYSWASKTSRDTFMHTIVVQPFNGGKQLYIGSTNVLEESIFHPTSRANKRDEELPDY